MNNNSYPMLQINTQKIYENAKILIEMCNKNNISITGVIKGFNGINKITEEFIRAGCSHIASSRLDQLIEVRRQGHKINTLLLRLPMLNEIDEMVRYADISLNSEIKTVELIEEACEKHNLQHGIVLMMDLGDLREGFIDSKELVELALHIENNLQHVKLKGIGTNLGCFGSVKPSVENLGRLGLIAEEIESKIGRKLDIVSGGETTSLPLVFQGRMPKQINNLRVGEAILLNRDLPDLWNTNIPGLHQDTFILKAQIIEVKNKPSYPIGEQFLDSFGNKPDFEDNGVRRRALLAVGRQDFGQYDKLIPVDSGLQVIGCSSDHLIVDIEDCSRKLEVGDIMEFYMYYGPMLFLTSSDWVNKTYII